MGWTSVAAISAKRWAHKRSQENSPLCSYALYDNAAGFTCSPGWDFSVPTAVTGAAADNPEGMSPCCRKSRAIEEMRNTHGPFTEPVQAFLFIQVYMKHFWYPQHQTRKGAHCEEVGWSTVGWEFVTAAPQGALNFWLLGEFGIITALIFITSLICKQHKRNIHPPPFRHCKFTYQAEINVEWKKTILIFCFCNILTFNFYFSWAHNCSLAPDSSSKITWGWQLLGFH